MRAVTLLPLRVAVLGIAGLSGSCNDRAEQPVAVAVLGPQQALEVTIRSAVTEGLVAVDAEGRIVPALADRWIVTDGGNSYIFRLRDGVWADGKPLTGETARAALRQALAALRDSPLRLEFNAIEEVRAMAGRVIEIRLSRPVPDLLQLLALPELGLAYRGKGAGPMSVHRDQTVAVLTAIPPERRGLPAAKDWALAQRPVRVASAAVKDALDQFAKGQVEVVLGGTFAEWPAVLATSLPGQAIRVDPALGLFGLAATHREGFLASAENREAIAMAIDRSGFADALRGPGWTPTTRIVGTDTSGDDIAERWSGLSLQQRRSTAAGRVARWRSRHGEVALRIGLPVGPGSDLLFNRVAADLGAVGFKVRRAQGKGPVDLHLIDMVAPSSDVGWYFRQLSCAARPAACNPATDAAYASVVELTDPAEVAAALRSAETSLTADNLFIPLGPPLRWTLASPDTNGLAPNRWALHPLLPLAMRSEP